MRVRCAIGVHRRCSSRAVGVGSVLSVLAALTGAGVVVAAPASLAQDVAGPVEVVAERDEFSTTFRNPDGSFTLDLSATPVRARGRDGLWHPIDTTLVRRVDGSVGPVSAVTDVSFSGGGNSSLVRIARPGGALSYAWPKVLPAPVLDGSSATYRDVAPNVDLKMTATPEGFRQVLIVKTRAAATAALLRPIQLAMSAEGLRVVPTAEGGLRALDGYGNAVLVAPPGLMWDSTGAAAQLAAAAASGESSPGSPGSSSDISAHPADGSKRSRLPVKLSKTHLSLAPDSTLLLSSSTVFPVYIDPPVGVSATERILLSSTGQNKWGWTNSDGEGVGHCGSLGSCASPEFTKRQYYEFPRTKLIGKQVLDATFRAYETWSVSCTPSEVELWQANSGISSSTEWPGPTLGDLMVDISVSAGRGTRCNPSQPAAWIDFHDNPNESNENLTSTVRSLADGGLTTLTLALRAGNESDDNSWKRFRENVVISVRYVPKPGVPTSVGVQATSDVSSRTCPTSSSPVTVADTTPPMWATVQTAVQPASGEETGFLRAHYYVERYDSSWVAVWNGHEPNSPGFKPDGTAIQQSTPTLTDGKKYRFRAITKSYDPQSGSMWTSGYSGYCYFMVDSTAPMPPTISGGEPYSQCTEVCVAAGGPGVAGVFTFTPAAGDLNVTGYKWRLAGQSPPTAPGPSPASVKPPLAGLNQLFVAACDTVGGVVRCGAEQVAWPFMVAAPDGPAGLWPVGGADTTKVADTSAAAEKHPLTLAGATLNPLGRRGNLPGDKAIGLNGTTGYAYATTTSAPVAPSPVVNTAMSTSLSAWALLSDASHSGAVVAVGNNDATSSGMALTYSPTSQSWVFLLHRVDSTGAVVYVRSSATTAGPPLNVWTHLSGVYDAAGGTIQLFVNGRPQPKVAVPAAELPVQSSGPLTVGRHNERPNIYQYFAGRVDEVSVHQRALTDEEAAQIAESFGDDGTAVALSGYWSADSPAAPLPDQSGYGRPAMGLSVAGAVHDPAAGVISFDGATGFAAATGPVLDESASFTVSSTVSLDRAALAGKPVGYRAQVLGQRSAAAGAESSWSIWYQQVATGPDPGGVFVFGRTGLNGAGAVVATAQVASMPFLLTDGQVLRVTGVYDAHTNTLRLFVDLDPAPSGDSDSFDFDQQGGGELSAGRARRAGAWRDFLPGQLYDVRIWAGAMTDAQIGVLI